MKLKLIHLIDKLEVRLLGHRFYFVCSLVADSLWWGDHCCHESGCVGEIE